MIVQAVLPITLPDHATFDNYISAQNDTAVTVLKNLLSDNTASGTLYIWGPPASGKSHLLFAACRMISQSVYLSLSQPLMTPEILDDLESHELVCIDDVQFAAGRTDWEFQLMALLEKVESENSRLVFTANSPPDNLDFQLADLENRLSGRLNSRLYPATDDEKIEILIARARQRGMSINQATAKFAVRHYSRDLHSLMELLDQLGSTTLQLGRRITIPLIKNLDSD